MGLYLFLALKGVVVGEFLFFYDVESVVREVNLTSRLVANPTEMHTFDSVICCTSLEEELQDEQREALVSKLTSCFSQKQIVINFRVVFCLQPVIEAPPIDVSLGLDTSFLVYWARLQLDIDQRGFNNVSLRKIQSDDAVAAEDRKSLLAICGTLHECSLSNVCRNLCRHIVQGKIFGHSSSDVSLFFRTLIHGHSTVASICSPSPLHRFVDDVIASFPPYPINLKRCCLSVFTIYAHLFENLMLTYSFDGQVVSKVLHFESGQSSSGLWSNGHFNLQWSGKNWLLRDGTNVIATQQLSFYKSCCIPSLGCVQASSGREAGRWSTPSNSSITDVKIKVASKDELQQSVVVAQAAAAAAATGSIHAPSADDSRLPKTEPPLKRIRVNIDSEVLCQNGFFFGWNPNLNPRAESSSQGHLTTLPHVKDFDSFLQSVNRVGYSSLFADAVPDVRERPHPSRQH